MLVVPLFEEEAWNVPLDSGQHDTSTTTCNARNDNDEQGNKRAIEDGAKLRFDCIIEVER